MARSPRPKSASVLDWEVKRSLWPQSQVPPTLSCYPYLELLLRISIRTAPQPSADCSADRATVSPCSLTGTTVDVPFAEIASTAATSWVDSGPEFMFWTACDYGYEEDHVLLV